MIIVTLATAPPDSAKISRFIWRPQLLQSLRRRRAPPVVPASETLVRRHHGDLALSLLAILVSCAIAVASKLTGGADIPVCHTDGVNAANAADRNVCPTAPGTCHVQLGGPLGFLRRRLSNRLDGFRRGDRFGRCGDVRETDPLVRPSLDVDRLDFLKRQAGNRHGDGRLRLLSFRMVDPAPGPLVPARRT